MASYQKQFHKTIFILYGSGESLILCLKNRDGHDSIAFAATGPQTALKGLCDG